jgi:hypothetical protein
MYVVRLQPHVYYSSSSLICGLFAILLAERPYGRMTTPRLAEFAQVTQPVRCGATLVILPEPCGLPEAVPISLSLFGLLSSSCMVSVTL